MIPLSRALGWLTLAPQMPTPSSSLELPPSTGRFWISAVRAPSRAEAIAAQHPAAPAPTTTTSNSPSAAGSNDTPLSRLRSCCNALRSFGGTYARSLVSSSASHRPK